MDLEAKIDDVRDMLHEMKPVVSASAAALASLDVRQRNLEIRHAETGVRLDQVISDVDGLGRKVRANNDRQRLQGATGHESGRWLTFLELLAVLPQYWHVILTLGMGTITTVALLWRHH